MVNSTFEQLYNRREPTHRYGDETRNAIIPGIRYNAPSAE